MKNLHRKGGMPTARTPVVATRSSRKPFPEGKTLRAIRTDTLTGNVLAAVSSLVREQVKRRVPDASVKDSMNPTQQDRLARLGVEALSTSELLELLLGNRCGDYPAGLPQLFSREMHGSLRRMANFDYRELAGAFGLGQQRAIRLVAALELGRRRMQESDRTYEIVSDSKSAFRVLRPLMADKAHEECWVLLLNNGGKVIEYQRVSSGGLTGTVVDIRCVLRIALRSGATSMILAHNHPAETLHPSAADKKLTQNLATAAATLQLPLNDHLIIAGQRYFSFRDEGLLVH